MFSCINFADAATKVKCPECRGTGDIDCPECDGTGVVGGEGETVECSTCEGSGTITPNISKKTVDVTLENGKTDVTAVYVNKESVEVTANVTADLKGHKATSEDTVFPPDEEVTVNMTINYNDVTLSQMATLQKLVLTVNAEGMTCPDCDGEGTVSDGEPCPDCDGTGKIECPECNGTGKVSESALSSGDSEGTNVWLIVGIAGAVVAVVLIGVGSFFLLKKRGPSEKGLRKLSDRELQEWVIKKLGGRAASSMDSSLGIDGFTSMGQPLAVKSSDSVNMNTIDLFASAVSRSKARNGVIVAFGFSDDAIRGKVRARRSYGIDIQMVTFRELSESRGRPSY